MRSTLSTLSILWLFAGCSGPEPHRAVAGSPARRWTPYCCEGGSLEHPRGCTSELNCEAAALEIECRPDDGCETGSVHCHCCRARGTRTCVPSSRSARRPPTPEPEPADVHDAATLFSSVSADVPESLEETLTKLSKRQLRQRAVDAGCESRKITQAETTETPKASVSALPT